MDPARAEHIEYVGGPLDGRSEEREDLPDELPGASGRYVRSVRCADDGAMRYVWRETAEADIGAFDTEGGSTWRTGS